ncbi:MAG: hypothetical protein ACRDQB_08430 [Thermocrispum sp.]
MRRLDPPARSKGAGLSRLEGRWHRSRPDGQGAAGIEALRATYAQYREQPPPGPLLRLAVTRALYWRAEGEISGS